MQHAPAGGLTIKAALTLGFGLTLGLWVFTGYQFASGVRDAERRSSQVASQYVAAQDLLSTFRRSALGASGVIRDYLLDTQEGPEDTRRADRVTDALKRIHDTAQSYRLVLSTEDERTGLARLRAQLDRFSLTAESVLARGTDEQRTGRALFGQVVLPERDGLLRACDDLQAINRAGFIQYQSELSIYHSATERRGWQLLGLVLALSLCIAILATIYTSGLERTLVQQLEVDSRNTEALRHLSRKLVTAQEEERGRIGRELHDEVGQALSAIQVELALANRKISAVGGPQELLTDAESITNHALRTVRNLSHLLHPAALEDLGLVAAVDSLLRDFSKRSDVRTELQHTGLRARLARDVELAAYRVIQSAVTNIGRHARAAKCSVALTQWPDRLEVAIVDDGCGFDVAELSKSPRRGLGLLGMRERVARLGGSVTVLSQLGAGTTVRVELPIHVDPQPSTETPDAVHPELRPQSANG
jgi:signal transduction histidine kinase